MSLLPQRAAVRVLPTSRCAATCQCRVRVGSSDRAWTGAVGFMSMVFFAVDGCRAIFERLTVFGAVPLQVPIERPYAVTD